MKQNDNHVNEPVIEETGKPVVNVKVMSGPEHDEVHEFENDIDHNCKSDREWLKRHIYWAMRNGRTVVMVPIEDETDEMKNATRLTVSR